MYSKQQEKLLERFAGLSDQLFNLNITTTDSFTGEIGEYIACQHFKLKKSERVTRAVDGICELGNNYQIKAKVVSNNNFNYNFNKLDTGSFHYLVIVYFDRDYCPIKIVRIPSNKIKDGKILITSSFLNSGVEVIDKSEIKISTIEKNAISEFAKTYIELEETGIIRSRRIVGDIGEFYACRHLNLEISSNKTEKGIDARHKNGLTFEIKARRVYESGRRLSENRRLNNIEGKTADYLIVVVIDRTFKCAGMWLVPMKNIINPKSAHLEIVNNTSGTLNLIPSNISWLKTGDKFISFDLKKRISKTKSTHPSTVKISSSKKVIPIKKEQPKETLKTKAPIKEQPRLSSLTWVIIILCVLYLLAKMYP